jgi:hypothetical protein
MNMNKRAENIALLTEGLTESVRRYEKAVAKDGYASPGYNLDRYDSKGSIQRRITLIREELLELSRSL